MFRNMRRFKQQLPDSKCIEILQNEKRGVLSVIGDNGYPYGIPMNHYYSVKDNRLYFHGSKEGHKIDSILKCDKVCYTVYDKGIKRENDWSLDVNSVVVFGRVKIIKDINKSSEICSLLCKKFTDDEEYIKKELEKHINNVLCLEIIPEHITGKLVNES